MNEIGIHITDLDGQRHSIKAPTDMGLSLMEIIRAEGFQIKATCGGMAMCATCNCLIQSNHNLPQMSEDEEAMLDEAFVLELDGSRLSCQIPLANELDGLEIKLGDLTAE